MSSNELADRIKFLKIDAAAQAALAALRPLLIPQIPAILDRFYAHLRQWPELAVLFKDGGMQRAQTAQAAHWARLFEGRFDQAYADSSRRIGEIHAQIGLSPRWYIGGYGLILGEMLQVAARAQVKRWAPGCGLPALEGSLKVLAQVVTLDMDLAVATYEAALRAGHDRHVAELADAFDRSVRSVVQSVGATARELKTAATGLTEMATRASGQVVAVAAASEQASTNVQTVAAAAEELSSSIGEIGRQVGRSSEMAAAAVAQAGETSTTMRALSDAAQKIGEVVGLISDIAGQTNLLALNATIEAARAGEAGKGFAVVASEVKNLASQTARATDDIKAQVEEIQTVVARAVTAIGSIDQTIRDVSGIATAIAAAVEEQGAATNEIARNVQQAAEGTSEVTSNIAGLTAAANETGRSAEGVLSHSTGLGSQTDQLTHAVDDFIRKVKAG